MFRSYYGSYRQLLLAIAALFIISGCSSDQDKPASNKSSTVSKSSSEGPICDSGDASTSDAPCIISTLKQLQAINDSKLSRAGHYALASDIDASATLKWTNDKGETQGFKPIEDFSGSFDGRGHTISHLYINHSGWGLAGLFAALSEASEISNLAIQRCLNQLNKPCRYSRGTLWRSYTRCPRPRRSKEHRPKRRTGRHLE